MAAKYSVAARKAFGNGTSLNTLLGATASLRIYSGTAPTNADDALSGNTLLAQLAMNATPFGSPSGTNPGDAVVFTANSITSDSSADATGTASFFRILDSAGTPAPQIQGTVGTSGADLNLNSTAIQSGAQVSVSSLTLTFAA